MPQTDQRYFRKGLGLKHEVEGTLSKDYHSLLVDRVREEGGTLSVGDLTFRLAKDFGFCYGVDRAVDYAYQSREKFPDKRIYLVGEIIHNPHVNQKLEAMGITILYPGASGDFDFSGLTAEDVVLLPAFGVRVDDFKRLQETGCILVDTTCGSVLSVWKRVEQYARDGYTAIVHGKHMHEETKATVSQALKYEGGRYLVVRNMDEATSICRFIEQGDNLDEMETTFRHKVSDGFDFERDLVRVGVANQTTMLASESLAIGMRIGESMAKRYGMESIKEHFRTFDTICSATQERQDAIVALIEEPLDAMVVIGGYNSSNTNHLAKICAEKVTTYHIADAGCIESGTGAIRHKPVDTEAEVALPGWLDDGVRTIGITAGASTPNNKIGEAIERILQTRGLAIPA